MLSSLPRRSADRPSVLTFAPLAWLKLQFFCHAGPTEIGGFGISSAADYLYVEDFITVRQRVTQVSVRFEDDAIADFFDRSVDQNLDPSRFARLWCHTHPGSSVMPSGTDEATFARSFGVCAWSVMFILGRTGLTYARLVFSAGPGAAIDMPVAVDWSAWPRELASNPGGLDRHTQAWHEEYRANIHVLPDPILLDPQRPMSAPPAVPWWETEPWSPELDDVVYEPVLESAHEPNSSIQASAAGS
jgi:hypothetical protein